ncbi:VWA domain-containing protein [Rhizobium sp. CCGE 510]|uniref:vWA domain-containing protein n=1 Tax=Rhizobium sp. CCGE 510 TaxID=1132836 RepID=UPI00027B8912|nr:VWA domain-containing protein [Rhizobium sp. CCGE 510]EJT01968.1 hypothetical protein RCCGE510_25736 [Rhizobium sp. CCGE 510]
MIGDFHFLRPWWLLALLAPALVLWLSFRSQDLKGQWKGMIADHLLGHLIVEPEARIRAWPSWLLAAILTVAVLGLSGPTWQREPPPFVSDTASLVIAVDLSKTMDAKDVSPSRLERAKLKIHDILASRPGARTAVIAYAGTAHLVVPLTDDADLIETYTDALAIAIMPKPGKDTAAAVKTAAGLLQSDGAPGTILLLTDGVETGAVPALAGTKAGLVVLGIGTQAGGLDLDALKTAGAKTGAAVATVTSDEADVDWIARQVRTNFSSAASQGNRWRDAGWYLLFPVSILFAFSFRRGWVVKLSVLLLAAHLLSPTAAEAAGWRDMWLTPDQQGRLAFERGDYASAADLFRDPMWKGVALYRAGRIKEAAESFAVPTTPEAQFDRGNALLRLENFEDAITAYENSLRARPDWAEADANLAIAKRLLKQQQDDEDQPQEPNEKPDDVRFDDKGKKGKAGEVNVAEQTSEMWVKNIVVSPADLMARKFAIEAGGRSP